MNKLEGIGIDIIEVRRLRKLNKKSTFLNNVFTKAELEYCFSFRFPAPRLAGRFAVKEAVIKASADRIFLKDIEVRRAKDGQPKVWIRGRQNKNILVSISHTDSLACAIAYRKISCL